MWSLVRYTFGSLITILLFFSQLPHAYACDPGCRVVFSDGFDEVALDKWFPVDGNSQVEIAYGGSVADWSIKNGKLTSVGGGGWIDGWIYAILYQKTPVPLVIDVDANMVTGEAILMFNSTGHRQNEYNIYILGDGNYWGSPRSIRIERYRNMVATDLAEVVSTVPIPRQSHLRVTRIGDEISVYINGVLAAAVIDPEPLTAVGTFGLGVQWDWTVKYDNVRVETCPNLSKQ